MKVSDKTQFKLRIDGAIHRKIAAAAKRNSRTVNAELVARLEASLSVESTKDIIEQALAAYDARKEDQPSRFMEIFDASPPVRFWDLGIPPKT